MTRSSVLATAGSEFPNPGSQEKDARVDAQSVVEETDPVVLIVDDDPVICDVLSVIFEGEGLETHAVYRGEAAIEWAKGHSPQAIILDLMMPGIDGWETCRRLKEDPRTARIPVIVLTARVTERDRNLSLWAGEIEGRGACKHPDGAVHLLRSAAKVFAEDWDRHARGEPCPGLSAPPTIPVPVPPPIWR